MVTQHKAEMHLPSRGVWIAAAFIQNRLKWSNTRQEARQWDIQCSSSDSAFTPTVPAAAVAYWNRNNRRVCWVIYSWITSFWVTDSWISYSGVTYYSSAWARAEFAFLWSRLLHFSEYTQLQTKWQLPEAEFSELLLVKRKSLPPVAE